MELRALCPGATELTAVPGGFTPSVGTILVLETNGAAEFDSVLPAIRIARAAPWCPLWVSGLAGTDGNAFAEFAQLAAPVVCSDAAPRVDTIRSEIRRRPVPSLAQRTLWLAHRAGPVRWRLVEDAMSAESIGTGAARRLRRAGLPAAHCWHDLVELSWWIATALCTGVSAEMIALKQEIDHKTVLYRCQTLTGLRWRDLIALGSWEACLESGLRHLKVLPPPPIPDRS